MGANRVFFPQQALDQWLDEGQVALAGDDLFVAAGARHFRLQSALHFVADVADTGDPHQLLGKVKALDDVRAMQGEHCADSVILGETAYHVIEGFLGEPLPGAPEVVPAAVKPRTAGSESSDPHPLARLIERMQSG